MKKFINTSTYTLLFFIVSVSSWVYPYSYSELNRWKFSSMPIMYYVNTSGAPAGSISAIQASFQTWQSAANSWIRFSYGGTTAVTASYDNINSLSWADIDPGVIAVSYNWDYYPITEKDIEFSTDYNWSTSDPPQANCMDVQNIATHEIGHWLRLQDLYGGGDSEKTMYGYSNLQETKKRTLDQDDINGVQYIYSKILVPYDFDYIHTALDNALSGQTVVVSSGSYSSGSVTIPAGITLQLNSGVSWSLSGSLTIVGNFNGNGSNTVTCGSAVNLSGSVYGINFTGSSWPGINVQSANGNLQNCSISSAVTGVNVYNGYAAVRNCIVQNCDSGTAFNYYSYGDIGPSGVFSWNDWDVKGDNTSYPSPGGSYYGYLSFRNPGYFQVYSTYPGTLYACGNYWGDCNYGDPIVTGNISWSNRLCNDPNPLMKKDDYKEIGIISLSKKPENKDVLPVLVKEPGIDKVDNARLLQIQGKYDEALSEFDNIINEYPDNFAGNISLVMAERCLEKLGRSGEILDKLNAASQKKSNKISIFAESRKGYQYMKKGKYEDAVDRFKFVLNTTQDSTLVKMSMFDLGNLYYKYLNDKPTGEKYYRNLIKLYPYDILSEMSLMALGEWKPKDKGKENKPVKETPVLASELEVSNYPNPFNPTTKIMYTIPANTRVKISIYNALGQEVEKILDEQKEKGSYSVEWNPGKRPSGIYYYRIMTDKTSITNKMVYTK